jgi:hypothetical protein
MKTDNQIMIKTCPDGRTYKMKKNTLPNFNHTPEPPANKAKTGVQIISEILATIRQLEPEDQNEVVKTLLSELAYDRHNSVRQLNEASARAAKSLADFVCYAQGIEKLLAMKMEEKK